MSSTKKPPPPRLLLLLLRRLRPSGCPVPFFLFLLFSLSWRALGTSAHFHEEDGNVVDGAAQDAGAVRWIDGVDFSCISATAAAAVAAPDTQHRSGCKFRRFPGYNALKGEHGGHKLAAPYQTFVSDGGSPQLTEVWHEVHERRYFFVQSEHECAEVCCGLREHCEVYVYKPVSATSFVCVYFAAADRFAPDRIEAKGEAVKPNRRPVFGGQAPVAVSGFSTDSLLWQHAGQRLEAEYSANVLLSSTSLLAEEDLSLPRYKHTYMHIEL